MIFEDLGGNNEKLDMKRKKFSSFFHTLPQKSCSFHKSARKEPKCLFNFREIKKIFSKIGVGAGVDLSEKYTPLKCWVSHTFIYNVHHSV